MTPLTIGKLRGLQRLATREGLLVMRALDHRGSIQRMMGPRHPESGDAARLTGYKLDLTRALAPVSVWGGAGHRGGSAAGEHGPTGRHGGHRVQRRPRGAAHHVPPGLEGAADPPDGRGRRQAAGVLPPGPGERRSASAGGDGRAHRRLPGGGPARPGRARRLPRRTARRGPGGCLPDVRPNRWSAAPRTFPRWAWTCSGWSFPPTRASCRTRTACARCPAPRESCCRTACPSRCSLARWGPRLRPGRAAAGRPVWREALGLGMSGRAGMGSAPWGASPAAS
ncbi:hypothetical protein HNQ10_000533 [Deinococcus metallilatus]|uniref:Uncharacterized protein n=1 Tax=Deinococcus metallilatus TaxID=1211322 RepID=A0ABR6MP52_9DEIO|nr:hypothetical protein [Deinococcus metallilatus]